MVMKNITIKVLFFSLLLCSSIASSQVADTVNLTTLPLNNGAGQSLINTFPTVLAADSAFQLSAIIELPDTIVLMWTIEEGYYLYQKSLKFSEVNASSTINTTPSLPPGKEITDDFFGTVTAYYDQLIVHLPFDADTANDEIHLQLSYQGCAEAGFCYPEQQKLITLTIR